MLTTTLPNPDAAAQPPPAQGRRAVTSEAAHSHKPKHMGKTFPWWNQSLPFPP